MLKSPRRLADEQNLEITILDRASLRPPEEITAWLSGKLAGSIPLEGLDGSQGLLLRDTTVYQGQNVFYAPEFGAVLNANSHIYETTAAEAKFLSPDYSFIPSKTDFSGTHLEEAGIFMAWGGNTNYGHFLIDCLPGIIALERAGIKYPLISPPLSSWHRELMFLLDVKTIEFPDKLISVKRAAWSNCMDHYMHSPNKTLLHLRDRILSNVGPYEGSDRVYVSRSRITDKRKMINELEVEERLIQEGFSIVHPQELPVFKQIQIFNNASFVIGATGAQMANTLFMKPGATAFEICPSNYAGIWVRNICYMAGVDWRSHYFPSPINELPHSAWIFSYKVDVETLMAFVRKSLDR